MMSEDNKESNKYRENIICRCKKENICCYNTKNDRCVPILGKRIFDCIVLKKKQSSFIEDVVFTIEEDPREFNFTESICIDKIGITYKFIGLAINSNSCVLIDSKPYLFHIPCEKILSCCNSYLYDENHVAVTTGKYCCNDIDNEQVGIQTRIIEKDLNFLVCEPKIFVKGRIGCREFTAIKDYTKPERGCNCECGLITPPSLPISIKKLGFNPITFIGRICLPQGASKSIINQKFENCLCIENVTAKKENICNKGLLLCQERAKFKADVELSLVSKKLIYSTIKEKLYIIDNINHS